MGSVVHHAGPAGAGAALKLAVNALLGVQVAALAEVLGALAKFGISPAAVARILGDTPVCSVAAKAAAASMVEQRFAPLFPAELAEKDLGYLDAFASGIGARVPLSQAAHAVLASAVARGFGAGHLTGVVRLYLDQQDSVFTNS